MNIVILDGYALNPGDLDWSSIEAFGNLTVYDRTAPELVVERAKDAEILLTNKAKVSAEAIRSLPKLRYIGELATGFDNVDIKAAAERNIPVCNIPGYSTASVTQLTWALILSLMNKVESRAAKVSAGAWSQSKDFTFGHQGLVELQGKTLGLIGFGEIGQEVAKIGLAFGMKIIAVVRHPDKYHKEGVQITDDVLACVQNADILSLHCPLTADNREMVNMELLKQMKSAAILINTARGALIQEQDLANALNNGQIAGAALDVLSVEPPPVNHPLFKAKNCLITPHVGWASIEARQRLMGIAAANINAFLVGKTQNMVNAY